MDDAMATGERVSRPPASGLPVLAMTHQAPCNAMQPPRPLRSLARSLVCAPDLLHSPSTACWIRRQGEHATVHPEQLPCILPLSVSNWQIVAVQIAGSGMQDNHDWVLGARACHGAASEAPPAARRSVANHLRVVFDRNSESYLTPASHHGKARWPQPWVLCSLCARPAVTGWEATRERQADHASAGESGRHSHADQRASISQIKHVSQQPLHRGTSTWGGRWAARRSSRVATASRYLAPATWPLPAKRPIPTPLGASR